MAADNKTLGRFELTGIAPAPRGVPQIEVTFDIDSNGIVSVKAKDLGTGKEQSVTITSSTNLTESDIDAAVKDAEKYAEEDKKRTEAIAMKNQADQLIFATEKALNESGDKISDEDKEALKKAIEEAKEEVKTDDVDKLKAATDKLSSVANPIFTKLYQQAQQAAPGADQNAGGFDNPDIH